jgi:glycosyltransferase involved in cell wall biosynthesis
LIEAAAEMVAGGAWIVLVGDGESRAGLEAHAANLGLADRVVFAGTRRDVGALLSAFDVFVSLATEEMYGLAPVEAVAAGLPVLVRHSPPLEAIDEPWIFRTTSDLDEIRHALATAARLEIDRHAVNDRYRDRFDVQRTVASLDDLYERVAQRRRS